MLKSCKLIICILFAFLVQCVPLSKILAVDYWIKQDTPTDVRLLRCTFPDSLNGWACGDFGTIIHTSNGGANWILQTSPVDFYIHDIFFLNNNTGWAVANEFFFEGTIILSTTDGGSNWDTTQFIDTTVFLTTIYYEDAQNGWIGGLGGAMYKTSNAGLNWISTPTDTGKFADYRVERFRFYSPGYGFACGGQIDIVGTMWKTVNNGGIWTSSGLSPEPIFDFMFLDSLNLIGVGGDPDFGAFMITTSNGGTNWTYNSLDMFGQGMAIAKRTNSEYWVPLAYAQNWAATFNGGVDWVEIPVAQHQGVWDAQFATPYSGWTVGDSGIVLKFNPDAVGIHNQNTEIPASLYLSQNYPNPFNPFTTIEYRLEKPDDVEIVIYDISGKRMQSVSLGKKLPGEYKYNLNGSALPSGVYFYKLISGGFSVTKKMMIVK